MMKKIVRNIVAVFIAQFIVSPGSAQPYIDIINARYANSPDAGFVNHNNKATHLNYFNVSATVPLLFKNKKDGIILSPYYEQWDARIKGVDSFRRDHFGIVLPVSLLQWLDSKWSVLITPIVRINDTVINSKSKWQFGGAALASYKSPDGKFTYKFGIYVNGALFGVFVLPLLGIDWRSTPNTNLFGVLPGSLTLEHRVKKYFYYGATFRAFTNSYTDFNHYWRIDENQLGLFADCYLTKSIVLNFEAGHSVFRKIRTGVKNEMRTDWQANDNIYCKLSLAYRMRFDKSN